jgi:hypothetical protein
VLALVVNAGGAVAAQDCAFWRQMPRSHLVFLPLLRGGGFAAVTLDVMLYRQGEKRRFA